MVPQHNLPRDNVPQDNPPQNNLPRRQSAPGDNMPWRQPASETTYPGDNLPRDNMPPRQCAPETTRPGDNMPRETICPGDYPPRFQNTLLVLDYVRLGQVRLRRSLRSAFGQVHHMLGQVRLLRWSLGSAIGPNYPQASINLFNLYQIFVGLLHFQILSAYPASQIDTLQ